ncbi:p-hydroxyphenylacetate 3-hydroxylase, reductase component [Paraburkholderia caffeinitolerans]|uniref:p-hydroxyphenylacetate 3-hydroxylase, reductase component n=1 Tax=Paraburkholderia caffeinitolerans TaxID=1723730 RepID=A0A6J5G2M8_9BURK|nr:MULTISPECIES: flavin reductase family protein [Paraburkholderia]CAB3788700.1 p-hydroxyphenylacetate 3-hydroxylase, reductase component [Paraburkholderia caffeinitolerans]
MSARADDGATTIDPLMLRRAFGCFATGVTIVTTLDAHEEPVGVTASSFNTVSLAPPLVLWSLARSAHSFESFVTANHFAVHVLDAAHRGLSERFSRASTNKFGELAWASGTGGVPVLPGMAATFECAVEHRYNGGDHLILVGRVLRLSGPAEAERPLLFHRGRYAALAKDEA